MRRLWIPALTLALMLGPAPSSAQQEQAGPAVTLDQIEDLTRLGRTEDARDALLRWWDASYADASRKDVQHALWLRGRLTVDPAQADLDFRRLVVEYPGGQYSDQALMRLAQSAFMAGDSAKAAETVARLEREYPGSPVGREARAWLKSAGHPPPPAKVAAVDETVDAIDRPPPDVSGRVAEAPDTVSGRTDQSPDTLAGRLDQQPDTLTGRRDESPDTLAGRADRPPRILTGAAAEPPAVTPEPGESGPTGHYAVQLGAFANRSRAEALGRRARDAGFDARLVTVPGSNLIRVRIGRFDAREDTGPILRRLRDLGFTAAVAQDAHREENVGQ